MFHLYVEMYTFCVGSTPLKELADIGRCREFPCEGYHLHSTFTLTFVDVAACRKQILKRWNRKCATSNNDFQFC